MLNNKSDQYPEEFKGYKYAGIKGREAYGVVCVYERTGHRIAVKFEDSTSYLSLLTKESMILRKLSEQQLPGIPTYMDHGLVDYSAKGGKQYNYLMMNFVSQTISEYLNDSSDRFKLSFGQICQQMVDIIRDLHRHGYLHKDIKPENFMIHDNQVYLIDFGITAEYYKDNKFLIKFQAPKTMTGTLLFCSVSVHNSLEVSRLDDLISLLYSILHIKNKRLPWEKEYTRDSSVSSSFQYQSGIHEQMKQLKLDFSEDYFDDQVDKKIINLVRDLTEQLNTPEGFYNEPDYNQIKKLLSLLDFKPKPSPTFLQQQLYSTEVTKEPKKVKFTQIGRLELHKDLQMRRRVCTLNIIREKKDLARVSLRDSFYEMGIHKLVKVDKKLDQRQENNINTGFSIIRENKSKNQRLMKAQSNQLNQDSQQFTLKFEGKFQFQGSIGNQNIDICEQFQIDSEKAYQLSLGIIDFYIKTNQNSFVEIAEKTSSLLETQKQLKDDYGKVYGTFINNKFKEYLQHETDKLSNLEQLQTFLYNEQQLIKQNINDQNDLLIQLAYIQNKKQREYQLAWNSYQILQKLTSNAIRREFFQQQDKLLSNE